MAAPRSHCSVKCQKTGYRDVKFEWGHVYLLHGARGKSFGADLVEAVDPAPAVISAKDLFPPATPQGLEAVVVPATPEGPPYVELAWGISPEADIAG